MKSEKSNKALPAVMQSFMKENTEAKHIRNVFLRVLISNILQKDLWEKEDFQKL